MFRIEFLCLFSTNINDLSSVLFNRQSVSCEKLENAYDLCKLAFNLPYFIRCNVSD